MSKCKYEFKGKMYTQDELLAHPDFVPTSPYQQRNYTNRDTDVKTDSEIFLFPSENASGNFVKYLTFKKNQLREYKGRISKIESQKKRGNLTAEELLKLNNEKREIEQLINGNPVKGTNGLEQDIADLEKDAAVNAVGYYVHKDLNRLDKLTKSNNLDDINEAENLIKFYELAGNFSWKDNQEDSLTPNPFFTREEIFLEDTNGNLTSTYKLAPEIMNEYREWAKKAGEHKNELDKRKQEATVNQVNTNPQVMNTYGGKKFTYEQLTNSSKGLKDTDWISMWTMDITNGLFSQNGLIPQTMFSYLSNSMAKHNKWASDIHERLDKINPKVTDELVKMGHGLRASGIIGLKGASYQLFKEITKEGNETGGLVQRFVKEFYDAQSKARNDFDTAFKAAKAKEDYLESQKAVNKAFNDLKIWRRNNSIILDINKVPELTSSTPETEAYKAELVKILGKKEYDAHIEKQKDLIKSFEAEKQSMIEATMIEEGVDSQDKLSDKAKTAILSWENTHSPKVGIEDYNSVRGVFVGDRRVNNFMNFNVHIPRKYVANISVDGNEFKFADTTQETGHYSKAFETIDNNPILSEFYDIVKEVCESAREHMPYEMQQKLAVNTVPAMRKSMAEILADKNTSGLYTLFEAFRHLWEKIRLSFGVIKQSDISFATLDPVTGRTNYKVNDQFLSQNARAVRERMYLEKTKFIQASAGNMAAVKRFSTIQLSGMNVEQLILLADYINADISADQIRAGQIDAIRKITGENVEIGKYIRDFSLHSVVQSQSFDLAKITKYFSSMTAAYAARQEALPILNIMKQHYESIQKPKTQNLGTGIYNANHDMYEKAGLRTNAIKQMDDWFERVVLDNYGGKHAGKYGSKLYSREEKQKIREINQLIARETNEKAKAELIKIKEGFGREKTATALMDNLLAYVRTLRLGYNLASGTTNFLEGVASNMMLSAQGEYFDPKEIYYGYSIVKHSFLKNVTFGLASTGLAKRNRKLMDKFNVIMDSKNELQKSSVKTYGSKLGWLNPHELNQRVEYINQSPVMIAMLRTMKITDKDGKESRLWEAFDNDGHLKEEFRTEKNVENWENLSGDDYLNFKQKLHKAIVLGHGNYDELRGMMIKSGTAGKALMMFKTWIPMQLYWRFATQQDDIQSGTQGFRGRYWSYGKGSAAVHGAVVGTAMFGPLGTLVGAGLGAFAGGAWGTDSGVGMLKETIEATKALAMKVFGMPVNLLAGRQLINTGDKAFESWVGKGKFTEQDAKNMRANMADIALQLAWLGLILLVKGLFWDDNDKPNDKERIAHNILVNKLMQMSSQASSYVNPVELYKGTIQSNGLWQFLQEVGKETKAANDYIHGRDIISSGVNKGDSQLWNQSVKLTMPGIFKSNMFGFESLAQKVYEESPFHPYFKSEATLDKEANKRDRAEYRAELEKQYKPEDFEGDEKEMKKAINKLVDELYPTPKKLDKIGMTRKEYNEEHKEELKKR